LDGLVISQADAEKARKAAQAAKKVDSDIDFDRAMVTMLANTEPYQKYAKEQRLLSPKSDAALRRLARGDIRLPAAERNALKYMLDKMVQAGFELPGE
jgi:hypothetical protein